MTRSKKKERAILAGAKRALNNPRLLGRQIELWDDCEIKPERGEVVVYLDVARVWVAVRRSTIGA
jgi:hypothetical protein